MPVRGALSPRTKAAVMYHKGGHRDRAGNARPPHGQAIKLACLLQRVRIGAAERCTAPPLALSGAPRQALLHGFDDERPGNSRVAEHLGEPPAFAERHKLPPRHAFGVGTAGQPTPMRRLRTDA
jgi:hypothetical protein